MNALAPMARLMGAGDLMVEYDQAYEHYGVPQPQLLALQLLQTPLGLSDPKSFGTPRPNVSTVSTLNEQDLSDPGQRRLALPARHLHREQPPPHAAGRVGQRRHRHGGRRHRAQQPGRARLAQHGQRHLLRGHVGQGRGAPARAVLVGCPTGGDRHQPQTGLPLGHADGQRRLHGDAEREPGQDGSERQPGGALPGLDHHLEDVRHLRRRHQRDGQQLRQLGVVHARGPGLQRHRRQLRHGLDHRHVRPQPGRPVVADPVPASR